MAGAALVIDTDGNLSHAGIVVTYNGTKRIIHFNPPNILFDEIDCYTLFFKELKFIEPELIPSFLAHCEMLEKTVKPKYFYFYANSKYDEKGSFVSDGDLPEYMTCVGFCLNVIRHFLIDAEFIEYTDWDITTLEDVPEEYIIRKINQIFLLYPDIDKNEIMSNIRRILPIDYLSAAFIKVVVRKEQVDKIKPRLTTTIKERLASN